MLYCVHASGYTVLLYDKQETVSDVLDDVTCVAALRCVEQRNTTQKKYRVHLDICVAVVLKCRTIRSTNRKGYISLAS